MLTGSFYWLLGCLDENNFVQYIRKDLSVLCSTGFLTPEIPFEESRLCFSLGSVSLNCCTDFKFLTFSIL